MDIGKKLAALVLSSVLILNLSIPAITAAEKSSAENGIEVTGEAAQSAEPFAEAQTADSGKEDLKAQFESLKNNSLHSLVEVFSEYPVLEDGAYDYYSAKYGDKLKDLIEEAKTAEKNKSFLVPPGSDTADKSGESLGAVDSAEPVGKIYYKITDNKLRISGEGAMGNSHTNNTEPPWYEYRDTITEIEVAEGITAVGYMAFYNMDKVKKVTLPSTLVQIRHYAFDNCSSLESINIPESVNYIGSSAFWSCKKLENINIPYGVETIRSYCFFNCESLKSLDLPDSVTEIENHAFRYCYSITDLSIPDSVRRIDDGAFSDCDNLKTVKLGKGLAVMGKENPFSSCNNLTGFEVDPDAKIKCIDGVLFDESKTLLICYPEGRKVDTYTIPQGVKTIGINACMSFTSNLEPIFTDLIMPDSVISVLDYAFFGTKVKNIKFSRNLEEIGADGFLWSDCKSIELPDTLTRLGDECFKFSECTSVTIPKNVESIGKSCFGESNYLTEINVVPENKYYKSVNGVLLTKDGKELVEYPYNKADSEYTLPESVEKINEFAFYENKRLKKIVFPSNLKVIEDDNFYNFNDIEEIKLPDSLVEIKGAAFHYMDKLKKAFVGKNLVKISNGFYNNKALEEIYFTGDLPIDYKNMLWSTSLEKDVTVYYPQNNPTWKNGNLDTKNKNLVFKPWNADDYNKVNISAAAINLSNSVYTFDGTAHKPGVTAKYNNKNLLDGVDYRVTYSDNTNAGKAKVTIFGIGDFKGETQREFTINKASQTMAAAISPSTIKTGETADIKVSGGVGNISFKSENPSVASVSSNGRITALQAGSSEITVTASGDNNTDSATSKVTIKVEPTVKRVTLNDLSYWFSNSYWGMGYMRNAEKDDYLRFSPIGNTGSYEIDFSGKYAMNEEYIIPLSSYKVLLDDSYAKWLQEYWGTWNGNCYGFASTAMMMNVSDSSLKLKNIKSSAGKIGDLNINDYSSTYKMNVRTLLEAMLVSQVTDLASDYEDEVVNDLNAIVREVKKCDNGAPAVMIGVYKPFYGGHELLAYRYEYYNSSEDRIHIYDCNHPFEDVYFTFYKNSSGKYTGWSYENYSSSKGYKIDHNIYENMELVWRNRRTASSRNSMVINSDNFDILNEKDEVVASMKNGELTSNNSNVYEVISRDVKTDGHFINMPVAQYTVRSYDDSYDKKLKVSVIDKNQNAEVITQSSEISFFVDDSQSANIMSVNGKSGEDFEIEINSDTDYTSENDKIKYYGKSSGSEITVGTNYGEYINSGYSESGIRVEGTALNIDNYSSTSISLYDVQVKSDVDYADNGDDLDLLVTAPNGISISQNVDYTVVKDLENKKAYVYGINDYKGKIEVMLDVDPIDIADCDVVTETGEFDYTGDEIKPSAEVYYNGVKLKKGINYSVSYADNIEAGTAKIIITGLSGFSGTTEAPFKILPVKEESARIIGDVNRDGTVDILDAAMIQKYTVEKAELGSEQLDLADVNDDKIVDILDASMIQKYTVEKVTEFIKK